MKFLLLFFMTSCMTYHPSNAIDSLAEEVIKRKEGVDIRLTPIQQTKENNK